MLILFEFLIDHCYLVSKLTGVQQGSVKKISCYSHSLCYFNKTLVYLEKGLFYLVVII